MTTKKLRAGVDFTHCGRGMWCKDCSAKQRRICEKEVELSRWKVYSKPPAPKRR